MTSVCTCGRAEICDRKCAGALMQQYQCAQEGHVTLRRLYQQVHGRPYPGEGSYGNFCFRCGAYEIVVKPDES